MTKLHAAALIAGLFASLGCLAAAPAEAPAGATGLCKDGSYYTGAEKKGACKGHKGIKDWYADTAPTKADAKSTAGKTAAVPTAATAAAPGKSTASAMPMTAAAGGGAGKVWVNTSSKVYHCSGDKWYGKTKQGEYMTEADAKAKGNHAERGKACS
jgi:hypothetical protein